MVGNSHLLPKLLLEERRGIVQGRLQLLVRRGLYHCRVAHGNLRSSNRLLLMRRFLENVPTGFLLVADEPGILRSVACQGNGRLERDESDFRSRMRTVLFGL